MLNIGNRAVVIFGGRVRPLFSSAGIVTNGEAQCACAARDGPT